MIIRIFGSILLFIFLSSCQDSQIGIVNSASSQVVHNDSNREIESTTGVEDIVDLWIPTAIEDCLASVNVGEGFAFESSFNPFYLRADLDGNSITDYAVLIKGKESGKRGVVICKDSKTPFIFGSLANIPKPVSTFDGDNFVTNEWEILTKEYTRTRTDQQSRKISPDAKGESILFVFEGGDGVCIYWNGKAFSIGE